MTHEVHNKRIINLFNVIAFYAYCGYPIPIFCEIAGWMTE